MTTAIFFAVDGTLLTHTADRETVVEWALETVHGEPDPELVATYVDAVDERRAGLHPEPQRAGAEAVAAATATVDPEAFVAALREAEIEATTVPDAARSALAALDGTDRFGIVTNASRARQSAKLDAHDLGDFFGPVVTAADAGAAEPDTAIYEYAREQVDADEYVMVGDDYEGDVVAPREAGFVPVRYEDEGPSFWRALDAIV